MTLKLQFDFVVDQEKSTITIKREFAGKRQLVWDCHTKSELLDRWFAPKPLTTKTKSMDFREGGHWHYAMVDPTGQEYWGRVDYLTIQPIDNYTSFDGFSDATGALRCPGPNGMSPSRTPTHTLWSRRSSPMRHPRLCSKSSTWD